VQEIGHQLLKLPIVALESCSQEAGAASNREGHLGVLRDHQQSEPLWLRLIL